MAKLFEKIDDNPGEYFGMLVEGYEDLAYDDEVSGFKPKKRTWADEKYDELMNKGKNNWNQDDWDSYNYIMQVWGESGVFDESLKESVEDTVSKILSKEVSQPRGFKWLSNNGTSGEVEYNGTKYAFRKLDNGKYKVMPSSKAGWNWSETLFKDESLKEDRLNEARKVDYLEADLAEKSGDKDIYDAYDENELTIVKDRDIWYFERCPKGLDKKVKTLMKKYYPELNYLYDESLKEDKFVPRDKMSKKDRKELDSKKRNTWGNTNPVTRVQPNKKAYDRKRDKKELDEEFVNSPLNKDSYNKFYSLIKDLGQVFYGMKEDVGMGDFSSRKEVSTMDAKFYSEKLSKISEELKKLSMTNN